MRGESRERERERWWEKEEEASQINQGQYLMSVSEKGEKRGGEQVCVCVCAQKRDNTLAHTPKGWGHSQNAAEVQQSCRPCRSTLFCLPYTQNTRFKTQKQHPQTLTHAEITVRRVNINSVNPANVEACALRSISKGGTG